MSRKNGYVCIDLDKASTRSREKITNRESYIFRRLSPYNNLQFRFFFNLSILCPIGCSKFIFFSKDNTASTPLSKSKTFRTGFSATSPVSTQKQVDCNTAAFRIMTGMRLMICSRSSCPGEKLRPSHFRANDSSGRRWH